MKRKTLIIITMSFKLTLGQKLVMICKEVRSYAIHTFGRGTLRAAHGKFDFYLYKEQISVLLKSHYHQRNKSNE